MIRYILLAALVAVAAPDLSNATDANRTRPDPAASFPVTLGVRKILLPVLPDFLPPSETPRQVVNAIVQSQPSGMRTLGVLLTKEASTAASPGSPGDAGFRFLLVATSPDWSRSNIDAATFAKMKRESRLDSERQRQQFRAYLDEAEGESNRNLQQAAGASSVTVHAGAFDSLGAFNDEPDSTAFATLQSISVKSGNEQLRTRQAMAYGIILVRGNILMVMATSKYQGVSDIDWVKAQVNAWLRAVRELDR